MEENRTAEDLLKDFNSLDLGCKMLRMKVQFEDGLRYLPDSASPRPKGRIQIRKENQLAKKTEQATELKKRIAELLGGPIAQMHERIEAKDFIDFLLVNFEISGNEARKVSTVILMPKEITPYLLLNAVVRSGKEIPAEVEENGKP